jgi:hypothetical protein
MSIQRYTNFENINTNIENEGKRIQEKDLFIFSQNQKEDVEFGNCKYDVLEVAVYDINNNLLPQKNGNNVSYLKMPDIKNYVYGVTKPTGKKELAIDIEKLMNDIGFLNGIYKVNLHFVKNKIGSDNQFTRVWIHEVSPSREEIRILPLVTDNLTTNVQTKNEFDNILNLSKEFKNYKNSILKFLSSKEQEFLNEVTTFIQSVYGKDYISTLQKDFGLSKFDDLKNKIYQDFKISVDYYLTNKYYHIGETNYGKPSPARFEDCESYDFSKILSEIKIILYDCILYDTTFLKKRNITVTKITKDFAIPELRKEIKNNLDSFEIEKNEKRIIYQPDKIDIPYKEEDDDYDYDEKNDAPPLVKPRIRVEPEEIPKPPPTPTPRTRIEPIDVVAPVKPEEDYDDVVLDTKPEPTQPVKQPTRVRGDDDSDEKKYKKVRNIKEIEKELNETIVKVQQPKRTSRTRGI